MANTLEFLNDWETKNLFGHPFVLKCKGACTTLHEHERDHTVFANKRIAVYALWPDGYEKAEALGAFPDFREIPAGVKHIVIALEEGETNCQCVFSNYDERGLRVKDPHKQKPPSEDNTGMALPALLVELLAHEGIVRCAA